MDDSHPSLKERMKSNFFIPTKRHGKVSLRRYLINAFGFSLFHGGMCLWIGMLEIDGLKGLVAFSLPGFFVGAVTGIYVSKRKLSFFWAEIAFAPPFLASFLIWNAVAMVVIGEPPFSW